MAIKRSYLSLDVAIGDDLPIEFRIFSTGVNRSEKGDFLFDAASAASVMAEYLAHGKALLFDFNHGTTLPMPSVEQGIAAGEFVPEVRADGLYATRIKWTPRAQELLRAKEYRFFSPYFMHDEKTGRILRLINCALTNLPALDGIAPLVAASANHHDNEEKAMDEELKKANATIEALRVENATIKAKLSAFEEKEAEKAGAVALRAQVLSLVGKANDAEAMGVLTALKASHERVAQLEADVAKNKAEKLSAEFTGILDGAVKDGKIAPAQRPFWEGQATKLGMEAAIGTLKGFVETAVALTASAEVKTPGASMAITDNAKVIAKSMGQDPAALAKFVAEQHALGNQI